MLTKLLIANRGEIAARIIRTAKALGYRTVAVYSDADAQAPHVRQADEAVYLGPSPASESYLNTEAILAAAAKTGADCLHPGYGFLSENAAFAKACQDAGLIFVGPPPAAIELMASKRRAKTAMQQAGVPVVPGFEGDNATDEELLAAATGIAYPIMIKASAGGGGRGMRLVKTKETLADNLRRARSEARQAFGDDELILEKAVIEPRHVEIQVFVDRHGNAVYLGERDCSVQRRHQKVVEEAPSPFVTPELREAMGVAAVKAALACGYEGAGTVEFLVDQQRQFYFLEMNTRLQVEHPVTEMVTGQDLVAWQLTVAEGHTLPLAQDAIELNGHAIEVRLYAEDPAHGFTPQTGPVHRFRPADGQGVRFDSGICSGDSVTAYYDPMLAKVIAWGQTRDEARRRLIRAIEDTQVFGVPTNRYFLSRILANKHFGAGEATTAFLSQTFSNDPSLSEQPPEPWQLAIGACVLAYGEVDRRATGHRAWTNAPATGTPLRLACGGTQVDLSVCQTGNRHLVSWDGQRHELEQLSLSHDRLSLVLDGVRLQGGVHRHGDELYLQISGKDWLVRNLTHLPAASIQHTGSGQVQAAMDGAIIEVLAEPGQHVSRGQTLVVLEAMKMEHPVKADCDGRVQQVLARAGDQVQRGQLLVDIAAAPES